MYLIEFTNKGQVKSTWTTREKLQRSEQPSFENQDNSEILSESNSSDNEGEILAHPCYNNRYNFRREIKLPERYRDIHTHLVNTYFGVDKKKY